MNQTILIGVVVVLLAIQLGLINITPLTSLFNGSGYNSDSDAEYASGSRRKHSKHKSKRKVRSRHSHSTSKSPPVDNPRDSKLPKIQSDLTPIALLNSNSKHQGYIRGTDLYSQNENVPWKSQRNLFGGGDDDQDDTEEIQMRIMEELEEEHYNNSKLIPNSV